MRCFNYFVSKELKDPCFNIIYVAKRGFSVKHYFHKIMFLVRSRILFLIPTLNKKSGPKYIVYVLYVWTGRDFLKAGFNSNIIPIIIATNLKGENGV